MKLEPLGQRVLVKRKSDEKMGVIIIPESLKKVSLRGDVIAVGPECTWVEVGDDIFFGRYSAFELPTNFFEDLKGTAFEKDVLIMNEEDILSRLNKEDK